MKKTDIIEMLLEVARAAYFVADDTCEENGVLTLDNDSFDKLSLALDELDNLPEPGMHVVGTGPAKAGAALAKPECAENECEFFGEICICSTCGFSDQCHDCSGVVNDCDPDSEDTICYNRRFHGKD